MGDFLVFERFVWLDRQVRQKRFPHRRGDEPLSGISKTNQVNGFLMIHIQLAKNCELIIYFIYLSYNFHYLKTM